MKKYIVTILVLFTAVFPAMSLAQQTPTQFNPSNIIPQQPILPGNTYNLIYGNNSSDPTPQPIAPFSNGANPSTIQPSQQIQPTGGTGPGSSGGGNGTTQVGTSATFTTSQSSCSTVLPANANFSDVLNMITCMLSSSVIPLIFALAVVMFVWGVVQYVINNDEEAKKAKGRQFMLWGIIALAVMVSVWGLVHILSATFNINYAIPQVNTQ